MSAYVGRVYMLDAVMLDSELFNILKSQLLKILEVVPPWTLKYYEAKLDIALMILIWKLSVSKFGATFGQQLLNIKYNDQDLTMKKKYLILIFDIMSYLHDKDLIDYKSKDAPKIIKLCDIVVRVLRIMNFLWFLTEGKYPSLTSRILSLKSVCISKKPRTISYYYMARELLWYGLLELFTSTFTVVNYQYIKRKLTRLLFKSESKQFCVPVEKSFTVNTKCSICSQTPILPQHMGCSHVYCYYCIQTNRMVDPKFECPECFHYEEELRFVGR